MVGSEEEVETYSTLTVDKDVTLHSIYTDGWYYMIGHNWNYKDLYGIKVNFNGKIEGEPGSYGVGFYVSGNYKNTTDKFVIGSSAVINATQGIYAAGDAEWTFSGTINGVESGIEIRAGKLNVTGGSIKATYIPTNVTANGNGSTTEGAAIAVVQHTTKLPIDVKISGGTFTAFTPFMQSNAQHNSEEDVAKMKISITGGLFKNLSSDEHQAINSVYSENFTGFISGGTYQIPPKEGEEGYIAEGYDEYYNDDDTVTVLPKSTITYDEVSTMKVGDIHNLNAKVSDAATEKYYKFFVSGEEGILKIEDGKLVALKAGKVLVVANGPRSGSSFEVMVYDVVAENEEEGTVTATSVANDKIAEILENKNEEITGVSKETKEAIIDAIEAGETIVVELETEKVEPEKEEVKIIEEKLDGAKVAEYFDINVILKVNDEEIGRITELGKKVEIELPVPEKLPEVAAGFERTYSVIRIHDGEAEVIAEGLTAKDGKIAVSSDKFSTYAMTYKDVSTTNPKTGDAVVFVAAGMIVAMAAVVVIRKIRK